MAAEFASVMAGAASAHQAATSTREDTSQQRAGRTRRTSADPQRAQQGATASPASAPAALDSLSRLQHLADASPQVAQLRRLQALADGRFAPVAQLAGGPEEEELVQGKFATAELQPQLQQAPRVNNTGLPDQLKSGIESLSGLSMDHVRVHYNSEKPAQLNALAYAQGSDINLAPGQERHLPHEAWHVVQQAQGRVKPTLQMAGGLAVNDDAGLEREADVMGVRALAPVAQLAGWPDEEEPLRGKSAPVQRWQSGQAPVADGSGAGREAGVRVHDPSSQPAAASALTYARGVGIQIAPGEVTPAAPGVAQRTIEGCSKIDDLSKYRSVENLYIDLTRDTKGDKLTPINEKFIELLTAQIDYKLEQARQIVVGSAPAPDEKTTAKEVDAEEAKAEAMYQELSNEYDDNNNINQKNKIQLKGKSKKQAKINLKRKNKEREIKKKKDEDRLNYRQSIGPSPEQEKARLDQKEQENTADAIKYWQEIQNKPAGKADDVNFPLQFLFHNKFIELVKPHRWFLSQYEMENGTRKDNRFGLSSKINVLKGITDKGSDLVVHMHCAADGSIISASIKFLKEEKKPGNNIVIVNNTLKQEFGYTAATVEKLLPFD